MNKVKKCCKTWCFCRKVLTQPFPFCNISDKDFPPTQGAVSQTQAHKITFLLLHKTHTHSKQCIEKKEEKKMYHTLCGSHLSGADELLKLQRRSPGVFLHQLNQQDPSQTVCGHQLKRKHKTPYFKNIHHCAHH